jgi:hypothetical protein
MPISWSTAWSNSCSERSENDGNGVVVEVLGGSVLGGSVLGGSVLAGSVVGGSVFVDGGSDPAGEALSVPQETASKPSDTPSPSQRMIGVTG